MVFEGHKTVREGRKTVFTRPFPVLPANKPIQKTPLPQALLLGMPEKIFSSVLSVIFLALSGIRHDRPRWRVAGEVYMEWHHAKRESAMALTPRYTKFELATLRATIFAEEDRYKFTQAKWSGSGFRHFRDPQIVCIEHFRPKPQARSLSPARDRRAFRLF